MVAQYVMSIDQGTGSTRAILFDHGGRLVSVAQREHRQHYPRPGWVEHDAVEIWRNLEHVAREALGRAGASAGQVAAVGIANQRETSVLWDRRTGAPIGRAIVWQDTRTDELVTDFAQRPDAGIVPERTGLPLATYFSAPRIRWLLDHQPDPKSARVAVGCGGARVSSVRRERQQSRRGARAMARGKLGHRAANATRLDGHAGADGDYGVAGESDSGAACAAVGSDAGASAGIELQARERRSSFIGPAAGRASPPERGQRRSTLLPIVSDIPMDAATPSRELDAARQNPRGPTSCSR